MAEYYENDWHPRSVEHDKQHIISDRMIAKIDPSCIKCYPIKTKNNQEFEKFWTWYCEIVVETDHCTEETITIFNELLKVDFSDSNIRSNVNDQLKKLAGSIRYHQKPSLKNVELLAKLIEGFYHSNNFKESIDQMKENIRKTKQSAPPSHNASPDQSSSPKEENKSIDNSEVIKKVADQLQKNKSLTKSEKNEAIGRVYGSNNPQTISKSLKSSIKPLQPIRESTLTPIEETEESPFNNQRHYSLENISYKKKNDDEHDFSDEESKSNSGSSRDEDEIINPHLDELYPRDRVERIRRRSKPEKFQNDYSKSSTNTYQPFSGIPYSLGAFSSYNYEDTNPTPFTSFLDSSRSYDENISEVVDTRLENEYYRSQELNSFFNMEELNTTNLNSNKNDDQKTSKTNINVRIPKAPNTQSQNIQINQKNSNTSSPSNIRTNNNNRTRNNNTTNMNTNANTNQPVNLTANQLNQLLTNHANAVQTALQNQNRNFQQFVQGLNLPQGNPERNHIKLEIFRGTEDEDPIEWVESFERACEANNIQNDRKVVIAAAYLKDIAGSWYEREKNNINAWNQQNNAQNNFKQKFIEAFSSRVKRDKWNDLLENIKQDVNETVDNYVIRFRMILKRADPNENTIGEETKIRRFRAGLKGILKPFAMMGGIVNTLDDMIERAKQAEFGVQQMNDGQIITQQQNLNTTFPNIPQNNQNTVRNNNTNVDDLVTMMNELKINMLNLANNQNGNNNQNRSNRGQRNYNNQRNNNNSRRNNNNDQRNDNNRNRHDNRDRNCWTCGEEGHMSPDCPSKRSRNNSRRNNRDNNERALNYFDSYNKNKNNYQSDDSSEFESEDEREIYVAKRKNIANNHFTTKKFKNDQVYSESQKERNIVDNNTTPSWQKALDAKAAKTTCKICGTVGHFTRRCPSATEEQIQKMNKAKTGSSRIVSMITEDVPDFNMMEHLKNLPCGMTLGQACKFIPGYRNDFFKMMKRKRIDLGGMNYLNQSKQEIIPTTAMKCDGIIEGVKVQIIIDTGAANSAISKKLADQLGYDADQESGIILVTANGTKEKSLGKIKNLEIELGKSVNTKTDVEIVRSTEEMILLGMDWIRKVKAHINIPDGVISMKIGSQIKEIPVYYTINDDDENTNNMEDVDEYETDDD